MIKSWQAAPQGAGLNVRRLRLLLQWRRATRTGGPLYGARMLRQNHGKSAAAESMSNQTLAARDFSSMVAKWLIPSVSALFVIVGYVVQMAQQALLGIGAEGWDQGGYVGQASGFFRDLVTRVADVVVQLFSAGQVPLHGHFADLAVATLVVVLVIWAPPGLRRWRPVLLPALLLVLLVAKFLTMDAPLSQVENVVLGAGRVQAVANRQASAGRSLLQRLQKQASLHGPEAGFARRAEQIWSRQ